jgi:DNA-binding transcriptional MocR family regulator
VKKGQLSDPPGFTYRLYKQMGTRKTGLPRYRCYRGSGGVEGYHCPLTRVRPSQAKASGPRWLVALTNAFDWRWTIKVRLRARGRAHPRASGRAVHVKMHRVESTPRLLPRDHSRRSTGSRAPRRPAVVAATLQRQAGRQPLRRAAKARLRRRRLARLEGRFGGAITS